MVVDVLREWAVIDKDLEIPTHCKSVAVVVDNSEKLTMKMSQSSLP